MAGHTDKFSLILRKEFGRTALCPPKWAAEPEEDGIKPSTDKAKKQKEKETNRKKKNQFHIMNPQKVCTTPVNRVYKT